MKKGPPPAAVVPLPASFEIFIDKMYRYVHCATVSKDDRKRLQADMLKVFGESSRPMFTVLEAQRKDILKDSLLLKGVPGGDQSGPAAVPQPHEEYLEGVVAWWETIKPIATVRSTAAEELRLAPPLLGPFPEPTLCGVGGPHGLRTAGPPTNVLDEFYQKLQHVSTDTLMKVLESINQKAKTMTRKDIQDLLMECMVRCGAERFSILMERGAALDVFDVSRSGLVEMLCQRLVQTVNSIPLASTPRVLRAMCLGAHCDAYDIVERVLVLGLQEVLRNVKSRVLKKIAQEVTAIAHTTGEAPSGNDIHDIIVQVFPQEQKRSVENSKGVTLPVPVSRIMIEFLAAKCEGHHGVTMWRLLGVSLMKTCTDRFVSPEFEFGGFKWSLLCMQHNGNLAVYLRQTIPVRCVFFVYILNRKNEPEVKREGTTAFTGQANDTDWGFASVVSFEQLLSPKTNIWNDRNDMMTFQVRLGILGGESALPGAVAVPVAAAVKDVAEQTRRELERYELERNQLEREVELEERKRWAKEQQKGLKASMASLKTAMARARKDIEAECGARMVSMREEADRDLKEKVSRAEKLRKQRDKIPKLLQSLQLQNDVLGRRRDEAAAQLREEIAAIAGLKKDIAATKATTRKTEEDSVKVKAELDTVQAEITETLELLHALRSVPPPPPPPLAVVVPRPPPTVDVAANIYSANTNNRSPVVGAWNPWTPI